MIYFSHPTGNQNSRAVLKALNDHHLLSLFMTTIANFENSPFDKLSKYPLFAEVSRRTYDSGLRSKTIVYPYDEVLRWLFSKLNWQYFIRHEKGRFSIDQVITRIDKYLANYILHEYFPKMQAIYAYEDAAYHSFLAANKIGLKKIYDLPIGYWRAANDYILQEKERWPEWANTLTALKNSEKKCLKKDKELEMADMVLVASNFTASTLQLAPFKPNNIRVIKYGFPDVNANARDYYSGKDRKLKCLYVGGLTQRKGIADVIFAADHFSDYIELTIVGQKTTNDCVPLNHALKKHHYIPYLPHHEIIKLMRTHDVLLFPSLFEGFGLVITEAMSQGLPVITTNRTAGGDFIEHDKNGWLITPGKTSELINIITYLLDHPDRIEICGRNAIQTAATHSWVNYGDQVVAAVLGFLKKGDS
jgi:glycosyltransferase involved in cell wall biosynthesis